MKAKVSASVFLYRGKLLNQVLGRKADEDDHRVTEEKEFRLITFNLGKRTLPDFATEDTNVKYKMISRYAWRNKYRRYFSRFRKEIISLCQKKLGKEFGNWHMNSLVIRAEHNPGLPVGMWRHASRKSVGCDTYYHME